MRRRTVLITGATGNLGRKLAGHFSLMSGLALRQLCLNPENDPSVATADLSEMHEDWASQFDGVDTVIHLAGNPKPSADWPVVLKGNIDVTLNVYEAARRAGVKRVVFASSNWTMAGYRFGDQRLTTDLPPRPVNGYGAAKLFGERLGLSLLTGNGISFIALRIGYCQRARGNLPGPHLGYGAWGQQMWLSDRDLCHGFERAVFAENVDAAVLNLMSDNPGMRWDIEQTMRTIGYRPADGHRLVTNDTVVGTDNAARADLERWHELTSALSTKN